MPSNSAVVPKLEYMEMDDSRNIDTMDTIDGNTSQRNQLEVMGLPN